LDGKEEQDFGVCSVEGRGPSVIRNEILIQRNQQHWTLKYRDIFTPGLQEGQVYLLKQCRGQNSPFPSALKYFIVRLFHTKLLVFVLNI